MISDPLEIQPEKSADQKKGVLEFLGNEEEDVVELCVEDFSVDEIVKLLTSNENGIFSTSKNAIFAGTAEGTVRENLSTLKECIQKNIAHDSENDKEQLTEVVQTEIKVSSGAVLYAYDELPDYSEEQIANYVSYYTTAENKLKEIVRVFEEEERDE